MALILSIRDELLLGNYAAVVWAIAFLVACVFFGTMLLIYFSERERNMRKQRKQLHARVKQRYRFH
jgi:hypothetical protein